MFKKIKYFLVISISILLLFFSNFAKAQCLCLRPDESLFEYTTIDCINRCGSSLNRWELIPFGERPAGWLDPFCVPEHFVDNLSNLFFFIPKNSLRYHLSFIWIRNEIPCDTSNVIIRRCLLETSDQCRLDHLSGC